MSRSSRRTLVSHKLRDFDTGDSQLDKQLNESLRDHTAQTFEKIRYFDKYTQDNELTKAEAINSVTPTNFTYSSGDVRRYGAIPDDPANADCTTIFNTALLANNDVFVPSGAYRIDGIVEVSGGKRMMLAKGASLNRLSANTSATTPVLRVIDKYSEFHGGEIHDENASADGVVILGHRSTTDDRDAWWWRFTDVDIYVKDAAGSYGVVVPSGQCTYPSRANYFGLVQNVNILGGDIGLYLAENANAHNINNVQFWFQRTACFRLRGAYANNASGLFFHTGSVNGLVSIQLQNKVDAGGITDSTYNSILGFTSETAHAADKSLEIESNCFSNRVIGGSNVAGGFTISNTSNYVVLDATGYAANAITAQTLSGAAMLKALKSITLKRTQITYSASITIDASTGTYFYIVANNGTAFTINAPTNPAADQIISVQIVNTSGGALGAVTWNGAFKMATWTSPATGFNRKIQFAYDGSNWYEDTRNTVDIPN